MRRVVGLLFVAMSVILPVLVVPQLPDRYFSAIAFSNGMQGPTYVIGLPCLVLMIQGVRMWRGED